MHLHQVPQVMLQDHIQKVGTTESCTQLQRRALSACCQSMTLPVMTQHATTDSNGIQFNSVKPTVHFQAAIISHTIDTTHQPADKLSPLQDQALSAKYHHLITKKGGKANADRNVKILIFVGVSTVLNPPISSSSYKSYIGPVPPDPYAMEYSVRPSLQ